MRDLCTPLPLQQNYGWCCFGVEQNKSKPRANLEQRKSKPRPKTRPTPSSVE